MNIDLINRLKTNENPHRIFADMTAEDQECLKKVGRQNCQYFNSATMWMNLNEIGDNFVATSIYRIKPDYLPEPAKSEYIDRPVFKHSDWDLMVNCPDGIRRCIDSVTHRSDFRGFWLMQKSEAGNEYSTHVDNIAQHCAGGVEVIARFEKRK